MDIFNIQALIREGKLVGASDIDPTASYLQVGVFQTGNRRAGAGNPDTYPSYAIPISEISGKSNKNMIVVDKAYGDDATAVAAGNYDFNKPFQTIDAAIANAQYGDTLWLISGNYSINDGPLLDLGLTIYAWNCLIEFTSPLASTGSSAELTIKGNATILFRDTISPTIETSASDYVNINIECTNFLGANPLTIVPLYINNADPTKPCFFTLKADYLNYASGIFLFAALNFNVNVDVVLLERQTVNIGPVAGEFWFNALNGNSTVYSVSTFNFDNAVLTQENRTNLINISNGKYNTVYLTGKITSVVNTSTLPVNGVNAPTGMVYQDNSQSTVFIDANLYLQGVGAYISRGNASKAVIKGSISHQDLTGTDPYTSPIYLSRGTIKLYAEIYSYSNSIIYFDSFAATNTTAIDINNCKLTNTSGLVFINTTGTPTIRLYNATFIITSGIPDSAASSVPLAVQIYSLYTNKAMKAPNITQALTAGTVEGEMVDIAMTTIGW